MSKKRLFQLILAVVAIMIAILPFMTAFNEVLTRLVERMGWYVWIQNKIIPWEVGMLGVIIKAFGIDYEIAPGGFKAAGQYARLTWNCLGWQSLVLLISTLMVGFGTGKYTLLSKIECSLVGLLGVFWVNMFRMVLTVLLLVYSRKLFAVVYHDYLAAITTILFLLGFWWFSFSYILEEKQVKSL
jgi:exosortase/archaeosortase family protein